jgi:hypothetical protein
MVDIDKIEKRTVQSFYEDGLSEIALGLIFLLLGGYFFVQRVVPEGSPLGAALSILFFLVVFSAAFLVYRVLRILKRRITYPRTGYVAFKKKTRNPKRRAAAAIVGGVIGASLPVLYGLSPSFQALFPAMNGLLLAVAGLFLALRVDLVRFYVLAAASAAIGVAVTAAGAGDLKGVGIYYGLFGAVLVTSGLAAFIVYLRRSSRPVTDSPEGPDAV